MRASTLIGLLISISVAGCSRSIAPQRSTLETASGVATITGNSARLFYPLDLGNHWHFHKVFTLRGDPNGPPFTPIIRRSSVDHDHVCVEAISGRDYLIDRITQIDSTAAGTNTYYQWVRTRQDPTGLYEADLEIGTPPACASPTQGMAVASEDPTLLDAWRSATLSPIDASALDRAAALVSARLRLVRELLTGGRSSGLAEGELTRLRYPLTVGRTWIVRDQPFVFSSTVEALETLTLPVGAVSAYRVRTDSPLLGPNDRVLTWYGRSGMLAMFVHVEIPSDLGLLTAEDVFTLEDLSIDRGRF